MITVIYSTHKDKNYNEKFKQHLSSTSGIKNLEILEFENFGQYSLSNRYNKGIEISNNNIIVCCHNDIKLSKNWGKKLLEDFESNPEFSILGKAGTTYFPESGVYWERMSSNMVGNVYHHPPGQKKWLSKYSPKLKEIIPVISLDGLFLSFDKTKINHLFDESFGKFHFYDHGFCIPNYLDGVKIGVTFSFDITHESVGRPNDEFFMSKNDFVKKYSTHLPIDLKPENIYVPYIKRKTINNIGKVAIIIPTKDNIELLFQTITSFYQKCDSKVFDVFIADTGSENDNLLKIKEFITKFNNINLIEYDYYNFAKINNDVVKNYLSDEYEFILFSNNDIKIMNDVIYGMLRTMKSNKKIGTVGCRLHYGDNTIQHDGMVLYLKDNKLLITHKNLRHYHNHSVTEVETIGNTGGLMMIRQRVFNSIGGFNESYESHLEDVELNLTLITKGLKNITCSNLVSYHYESQTRGEGVESSEEAIRDYKDRLIVFISNNLHKLKKHIISI